MPDAAASILAVHELVPDTADALLESVGRHYTAAPASAIGVR
jgi:hypothetical protein